MHLPFYYMLKTSVCLAATGIFYFALLRRLTQYSFNRWFLLGGTLLSFVLPLVNINSLAQTNGAGNILFIIKPPAVINMLPQAAEKASGFAENIQLLFFLLFSITAVVLLTKFLVQFISLKKIIATAQPVSRLGVSLYNIEGDIAPFSFNKSIYINIDMYSPAELEEVIRHETVHVKQNHTADVIIAELACILNWYNPFAWMLKNAIKQNLEFIADDTVLKVTQNHKAYQYLLLKVAGNAPLGITNNLNVSSLKNRIVMMNKNKTSRLHLLRLLLVIPVVCVLLPAFRQAYHASPAPTTHNAASSGETFTLGNLTYAISDASVETLIKKEQFNSFLKPGNELSLSSIQNEKLRLTDLLQKNGYDTSGNHAIYFEVDTFSTKKSFSIQVTVNVQRRGAAVKTKGSTPANTSGTNNLPNKSTDNKIQAYVPAGGVSPLVNERQHTNKINLNNTRV